MISLTQPAHALLTALVDKGSQNRPIGDSRAGTELQEKQLAIVTHLDPKTINVAATQLGRGYIVLERSKKSARANA